MRYILVLGLMIFWSLGFSQREAVAEKLKSYGFDEGVLSHSMKDTDGLYGFRFEITTFSAGKKDVEVGRYDPKLPEGKRWVLESHNGKEPTKHQIKHFDKAHNTTSEVVGGQPDDDSWKWLGEYGEELRVSFRYDRDSLSKKYSFLADCTGIAYLNKVSKRLERVRFRNDKPLMVKVFRVKELDMEVTYKLVDDVILKDKQRMEMTVDILGELQTVIEETVYSNYRKVISD